MRKRSFLLVAGACLAALSLTAGSALADPDPPQPPFRALQGVGSDTSQLPMDAYADGGVAGFNGIRDASNNLLVASWNATGSPTITTFNTAQCTNIPRPNGSTAGVNALSGLLAGFPAACANWARSSNNDSGNRPGQNLTYIPFALDGLTYSTLSQSQVPKSLTLDQLRTIYRANGTPGSSACFGFRPLNAQPGSGTGPFWTSLVGPMGTCVRDVDPGCVGPGNPTGLIQEHDGCWTQGVGANTKIAPFGVGPWISQATNTTVTDRRGSAILRAINGESPFELSDFPGARTLYNVVRNADVGTPNFVRAFGTAAQGGQICSNPAVLESFGLLPTPNCGSTTIQTPPN